MSVKYPHLLFMLHSTAGKRVRQTYDIYW